MRRFLRPLLAIVGLFVVLAFLAVEADARAGRGGSAGSRGSRTYTPPPATTTAPTTARPMQRSTTPATQPSAARPATPAGAPAKPGLFNRPGFLGGLAAGMLGAGLLGLLFGQGLFGNMAGFASFLGLLIQLALIGGVAYLIVRWWKSRSQPQPAFAGAAPGAISPQAAYEPPPAQETARPLAMQSSSSYGASDSFLRRQEEPSQPTDDIGIKPEDYDTFERLLGEIQTYYSKEDTAALRARVTPEMMGYLSEELADNASRGVMAQLSGVKLLQGDLAEAWAEDSVEYATVAMRYEIVDTIIDRNTQKLVDGDPTQPVEVTELWTFARSRSGGNWLLSAIQQVDGEDE